MMSSERPVPATTSPGTIGMGPSLAQPRRPDPNAAHSGGQQQAARREHQSPVALGERDRLGGEDEFSSRLLAAGCEPAYVMAQVGHTDPTLTLRIYQQLLKRRRREEYRERVNELLGTSPAATGSAHLGPNSGPNSLLVRSGRSALS